MLPLDVVPRLNTYFVAYGIVDNMAKRSVTTLFHYFGATPKKLNKKSDVYADESGGVSASVASESSIVVPVPQSQTVQRSLAGSSSATSTSTDGTTVESVY